MTPRIINGGRRRNDPADRIGGRGGSSPRGSRGDEERWTCTECGGVQVAGNIGFPLLGSPKFSYKVRTLEVSVEVVARMCESCGLVEFRAKDPRPIKDARAALRRAGEAAKS